MLIKLSAIKPGSSVFVLQKSFGLAIANLKLLPRNRVGHHVETAVLEQSRQLEWRSPLPSSGHQFFLSNCFRNFFAFLLVWPSFLAETCRFSTSNRPSSFINLKHLKIAPKHVCSIQNMKFYQTWNYFDKNEHRES